MPSIQLVTFDHKSVDCVYYMLMQKKRVHDCAASRSLSVFPCWLGHRKYTVAVRFEIRQWSWFAHGWYVLQAQQRDYIYSPRANLLGI